MNSFILEETTGIFDELQNDVYNVQNNGQIIINNDYINHVFLDIFGIRNFIAPARINTEERFLEYFRNLWIQYLYSTKDNFIRAYDAFYSDYNPIENYDRKEIYEKSGTLEFLGSETSTKTGTEENAITGKESLQKSGTDNYIKSGTETTSKSGNDSVSKSGMETTSKSGDDTIVYSGSDNVLKTGLNKDGKQGNIFTKKTGEEVETSQVSAYNDDGYSPQNKSEKAYRQDGNSTQNYKDVIVSNAVDGVGGSIDFQNVDSVANGYVENEHFGTVDSHLLNEKESHSFDNRNDKTNYNSSENLSFQNRQDTTNYNSSENLTFSNRQDSTVYGEKNEKTFDNRKDTTTYNLSDVSSFQNRKNDNSEQFEGRTHGNIGITTTQQMILSELELRKENLKFDYLKKFIDSYSVLI